MFFLQLGKILFDNYSNNYVEHKTKKYGEMYPPMLAKITENKSEIAFEGEKVDELFKRH